ncbi:MAG: HNH endonuclease [Halanaerobiales bacterium]|nr:HNH endonuclease [Halanaerobiales bacterium]
MKELKITYKGKEHTVLVDDEDFERVNKYKWHVYSSRNTFYAITNLPSYRHPISRKRIRKGLLLHRFVMEAKEGEEVDHRNHDGLDNRKENLRVATGSQNHRNRQKSESFCGEPCTSKYKGVSWQKSTKKWRTRIDLNKKQHYIGSFTDEIEAAKAYNKAASTHFGEFAYLNKIEV